MAVIVLPKSLRWHCVVSAAVLTIGLAVPSWLAAESRDKTVVHRKAAISPARGKAGAARDSRPPSQRQTLQAPAQEEIKKKPSEVRARKSTRRSKVSKRHHKAAPSSRPDLAYHGILYRPQRYDPSRGDRRTGGAPNPHAAELVHDHFLELDRNRDGSIDPMERTLGRLDLDRDLANRRWN